MRELIPPNAAEVVLGLLVALTTFYARKGQKDSRETKDSVKNGISDKLEHIKGKLDNVSQRLDDHIESHKERTHYARKT